MPAARFAPGLAVSMDALIQARREALSCRIGAPRKETVGRTTMAAIQSGLIFGYTSLVDGLVERIRKERGEKDPRDRELAELAALDRAGVRDYRGYVDEFLTLKGLRLIFERNRR